MELTPGAKSYLILNMDSAPDMFETLLSAYGEGDPLWDQRADPERFSLREVVAHLADWEEIFAERIVATRDQDNPTLPDRNEVAIAADRQYSKSNPIHNLQRFRAGRRALVGLVKSLPEEAWERPAHKVGLGNVTIAGQASLITWHDGYHLKQVLDHLRGHGRSTQFSVPGEAEVQPAPVC